MSETTSIEWTDATWNVVTGCTKVSAGCKHCYAERDFHRPYPGRDFGDIRFHPDRLDQPLRWRHPRRVFVNSLSDLFHESVADEVIDQVFGVMALASHHTFQVLTKRPERMHAYVSAERERGPLSPRIAAACIEQPKIAALAPLTEQRALTMRWPLPNVWLGISAENQPTADERILVLLQTPAAVRFVSLEPLLGPVDLGPLWPWHWRWPARYASPEAAIAAGEGVERRRQALCAPGARRIDWVIVGGESGPGARPCDVAWIRSIVEQCRAANVAAFVKQLGALPVLSKTTYDPPLEKPNGTRIAARSEVLATRSRKGSDPAEWPVDLRVRDFPEVRP